MSKLSRFIAQCGYKIKQSGSRNLDLIVCSKAVFDYMQRDEDCLQWLQMTRSDGWMYQGCTVIVTRTDDGARFVALLEMLQGRSSTLALTSQILQVVLLDYPWVDFTSLGLPYD